MNKVEGCFLQFREQFQKEKIDFLLLDKEAIHIERIAAIMNNINSEYVIPTDDEVKLRQYYMKLIENAYNFVLVHGNEDIAILSIYANNFQSKIAYTSTIGIVPSFRGGTIAPSLVKFALQFAKEAGMEVYKAEIDKKNTRWLAFLTRYHFRIESETNNNSYIVSRDL